MGQFDDLNNSLDLNLKDFKSPAGTGRGGEKSDLQQLLGEYEAMLRPSPFVTDFMAAIDDSITESTIKGTKEELRRKAIALEQKIFLACEAVADRYADGPAPSRYPELDYSTFRRMESKSGKTVFEHRLKYFEELDSRVDSSCFRAPGKVGQTISRLKTLMTEGDGDPDTHGFCNLMFLLAGLLGLGYAAEYIPVLPSVLPALVQGGEGILPTVLKVVCWAVMGLAGLSLFAVYEEYDGPADWLTKPVFTILMGLMSVAFAFQATFGQMEDTIALPVTVYYLVLAVAAFFSDRSNASRARKEKSDNRSKFRESWQREKGHIKNYITFHENWWRDKAPGQPMAKGVCELKKIWDKLEGYDKSLG